MDPVDVIAVVGTCVPERHHHAQRLAEDRRRWFLPAKRLAMAPDPVDEAAALAPWCDRPNGVVAEFPSHVAASDVIGALAHPASTTNLSEVICVVDAAHLLDDLRHPARSGEIPADAVTGPEHVTHRTVTQIEFASTVVLVMWEHLPTATLSTIMAVISALSPHARLRLDHRATPLLPAPTHYSVEQRRPGWIGLINGSHDPHMSDRRVCAFRYENMRPLKPLRLEQLLHRMDRGEFGTVIRSAGFCRLSTRPHVIAQWNHVGSLIGLEPLAVDTPLSTDEEPLAYGQDLAIIGLDLDRAALVTALDHAALTDEEFVAGPTEWARHADPFPAWRTTGDRSD